MFKLINIFKKEKRKYGGLIEALGLSDFWDSLNEDERQFIRECYSKSMSIGNNKKPEDLDGSNTKIIYTTQTPSNFLNAYAVWAKSAKKYELAEKLLKEAEKRTGFKKEKLACSNDKGLNTSNSSNAKYREIIDKHFTYNHYIELYYKQRDKGPEYLEKCIEYCKKDIELFPKFKDAWIKCEVTKEEKAAGYTFNLRIPSFERLAIIYEKQGKIDEAIEICKKAIEYGLHDGTKGGFQGRLNRLYKKLTKNSSKEE